MDNRLVSSLNSHGFGGRWFVSKPHLLLEVNLSLLVRLLSVLELPVSLVDKMVASGDMVMPIILDAFSGVLLVEVELNHDLIEQLILNWHLLFAREYTLVSEFVLHLKGPCMVSNVVD